MEEREKKKIHVRDGVPSIATQKKNPRLLLLPHTPQTGKHVMLAVHRFLHSLSPMEYTDGMEAIRFAGLCTERCPFHD